MRHAFLIIAHNNWWQLKKLIQLLDADSHDIYVHIDKKSTDFLADDFCNITQKSKVMIYQEFKVFWGGYCQIEVELFLFEKAHEAKYDYYHLISGVDLPLKNNDEIDAFFEENRGKEFISYDEDKLLNDPEIKRRTKLYHYLQNYRRGFQHKWLNSCFTFLERISLGVQIILRINRVKNLDWIIKYGSNWVSITDDLVIEILKQKSKIKSVFSHTNCADELFVHTVAYNCGFKDHIYLSPTGNTDNMRNIDWERGKNGNPYTFRLDDKEILLKSDALFARKFSETIDREIIKFLCEMLNLKSGGQDDL